MTSRRREVAAGVAAAAAAGGGARRCSSASSTGPPWPTRWASPTRQASRVPARRGRGRADPQAGRPRRPRHRPARPSRSSASSPAARPPTARSCSPPRPSPGDRGPARGLRVRRHRRPGLERRGPLTLTMPHSEADDRLRRPRPVTAEDARSRSPASSSTTERRRRVRGRSGRCRLVEALRVLAVGAHPRRRRRTPRRRGEARRQRRTPSAKAIAASRKAIAGTR